MKIYLGLLQHHKYYHQQWFLDGLSVFELLKNLQFKFASDFQFRRLPKKCTFLTVNSVERKKTQKLTQPRRETRKPT